MMPTDQDPSRASRAHGEAEHDASPTPSRCERAQVLKDVILNRHSVRQFSRQHLNEEDLHSIIEAGVYAPSGSNAQNQRFLLLTDADELQALGSMRYVWPYPTAGKMRGIKPTGLIGDAPVAIVVFSEAALSDFRDNGEYHIWEALEAQNCAAAIENMLLMATALGIGSCWISASAGMSRTRLLSGMRWTDAFEQYDIPLTCKIQGIVLLGHPRARLDESGFPVGEKEHGASIWSSTKRHPLEHYLIQVREDTPSSPKLSHGRRCAITVASKLLSAALATCRTLDQLILRLEKPFLPKR